jgi:ketosteroid isomerase-like protein
LFEGRPSQGLVFIEKRTDGRSGGDIPWLEIEMHEKARPAAHPFGVRPAPALGGIVNRRANAGCDLDIAKIAAVRAAWIRAVEASDINGLIALATEDIVVVHGNGKAAIGTDALMADLRRGLAMFDVEPRDSSAEIIVHDKWAIEFCEVDQTVSGVKSGTGVKTHSRIVAVFSRQPDGSWKVARVIGLPG